MRINKWIIIIFFIAALIGFADSSYLTAQHIRNVVPPCGFLSNCDAVLTSRFAEIGPIPVSMFGMLYYGLLIVLLVAYLDVHSQTILHGIAWLVSAGMLFTIYLIVIQAAVLHAFCPYCLTSALATLLMFILSVYVMRKV